MQSVNAGWGQFDRYLECCPGCDALVLGAQAAEQGDVLGSFVGGRRPRQRLGAGGGAERNRLRGLFEKLGDVSGDGFEVAGQVQPSGALVSDNLASRGRIGSNDGQSSGEALQHGQRRNRMLSRSGEQIGRFQQLFEAVECAGDQYAEFLIQVADLAV